MFGLRAQFWFAQSTFEGTSLTMVWSFVSPSAVETLMILPGAPVDEKEWSTATRLIVLDGYRDYERA